MSVSPWVHSLAGLPMAGPSEGSKSSLINIIFSTMAGSSGGSKSSLINIILF